MIIRGIKRVRVQLHREATFTPGVRKWLVILIASAFLFVPPACAQLVIDKAKIKRTISPGQALSDTIGVHNFSKKTLHVTVYYQDFVYVPPFDGRKEFLPQGSTDYSCGSWVTFSPQELTLPPFGEQEVSYTIKVPEVVSGGYYGVLFFEVSPGDIVKGPTRLKVIQRIGCLMFLETTDKKKSVKIENISSLSGNIEGKIINQGNVILLPHGVFYIMDAEGMVVGRGELETLYIPPEKIANFSIDLPNALSSGRYTLVVTFDLEDGDVFVNEIDFEKDSLDSITILQVRE